MTTPDNPRGSKIEKSKKKLSRSFGQLHRAIEFCGKHPFVTGLLAILGLFGLWLTIVGYSKDREDAASTTNQISEVSEQLEEIDGKIGESYRQGIFLLEEKIEIYFNDWWGHPHASDFEIQKYGQAELTVRGEGKTVDFTGTLSMNCENSRYFWKGGQDFQSPLSDEEIEEIVPKQIYRNVYKLLCRAP